MGKCQNKDFIESFEDLGLQIGKYCCLNEYMKILFTKSQGHSLTFVQGLS